MTLLGRESEIRILDGLVEAVLNGRSGSLVLLGEPGLGKTSLLDHVAASDVGVIRLAGIECETSIEFGGIQRLLLPHQDLFAFLPARQHEALLVALGARDDAPALPSLVGLAVLGVLALASESAPFVCLVDDAHWLDDASLDALGFVARRLYEHRFGFVLSSREHDNVNRAFHGLPTHRLAGLDPAASLALLGSLRLTAAGTRVADRIVTEAEGNPLAIVELCHQFAAEQWAGRADLPELMPIAPRLATHLLADVHALPAPTRSLVFIASAMCTSDPSVLWRAAQLVGLPSDAADAAQAANVMIVGETVTFPHPLVRSAIYHAAQPRDRRRVHGMLAEIAKNDNDARLVAWHRAAATTVPDEEVAAELHRSATLPPSTGGQLARARFFARAAELSPGARQRNERTLLAAEAYLAAGDGSLSGALLDKAAPWLEVAGGHTGVERMRAMLAAFHHNHRDARAHFLKATTAADPRDEDLVRELLLGALACAAPAQDAADRIAEAELARTVLGLRAASGSGARVRDSLLAGLATRVAGEYSQVVPALRHAVEHLYADDNEPDPLVSAGTFSLAADEIWDDDGRRTLLERALRSGRRQGTPQLIRQSLMGLSYSQSSSGQLDAAERSYREAAEVAASMGLPHEATLGPLIRLSAWQGRELECQHHAEAAEAWATRAGSRDAEPFAWSGLCILQMGLGNYREALEYANRLSETEALGLATTALPEVIEAAARVGEVQTAQAAFARLKQHALASGTPWALGMLARSTAILAPDDQAESHYLRGIELLSQTSLHVEVARTQLLYGQWLRRQKRRKAAQVQLSAAYVSFESMGISAFAARASAELTAAGHRVESLASERTIDVSLTPQESHVARRAALGATNSEIAVQMYLTTSTVEYHLSKVFRKLNITSRRQLTDQLR